MTECAKKTRPHTFWLDEELDHWMQMDALRCCLDVSAYVRMLIAERMTGQAIGNTSLIDEIRSDLSRIVERLR